MHVSLRCECRCDEVTSKSEAIKCVNKGSGEYLLRDIPWFYLFLNETRLRSRLFCVCLSGLVATWLIGTWVDCKGRRSELEVLRPQSEARCKRRTCSVPVLHEEGSTQHLAPAETGSDWASKLSSLSAKSSPLVYLSADIKALAVYHADMGKFVH